MLVEEGKWNKLEIKPERKEKKNFPREKENNCGESVCILYIPYINILCSYKYIKEEFAFITCICVVFYNCEEGIFYLPQ